MQKTGLAIRQVPFQYELLPEHSLKEEYVNGKRFYNVDGELFPSVTTVLSTLSKDGILAWRNRVGEEEANRIMRQAATRGTKAHKMWEEYLRNDPDFHKGAMPNVVALFKQLQPWLDRNIDHIYGNEIPLYSKALKAAGRCDCVASVNGRPAIIDFKTSSKQKNKDWIENYFLQVSTYALMVEEMYGLKIEDAYILVAVEDDRPQSFPIRTKDYKDKVKVIFSSYHANQLQ